MFLLRSLVLAFLFATSAHALVIDARLPDAAQEQRAQTLFHAMRCIVCEGQSLAESDAGFAIQMRAEIRRMVAEGQSNGAITEYFVARYGHEILQTPPLAGNTLLLWLAPVLLLAAAAWFIRPRRLRSPS